MTKERKDKNDPIRLLNEEDPSLTFLNTHVDGHDGEKGSEYIYDAKSDHKYDEETANEFPAHGKLQETSWTEEENSDSSGKALGTMALVLSITSLFLVPLLLGVAGVICGAIAVKKGARALGFWAVGIGVVSIAGTIIFSPFF